MFKKILFVGLVLLLLVLLVSCVGTTPKMSDTSSDTSAKKEMVAKSETSTKDIVVKSETKTSTTDSAKKIDWKQMELTDAVTGKKFKIADFKGKDVLVQSFAVWCPKCLRQSKEMAKLSGVVKVSLDTDPNEDLKLVKGHATKNNFDWSFVVTPVTVTKELIAKFGVGVVNAPSEPVILVCKDQSTRLLPRGLKTSTELQGEIKKGC